MGGRDPQGGRQGRLSLRNLGCVLLALGLAACGGGVQMLQTTQAPAVQPGESLIVFMRTSAMGAAVSASVFDVTGTENELVGIVQYGTKVAYPVKPGERTFMVIGESADFMRAAILPGRTYYALVTPRPGVWKARFSLRPIRQAELDGAEFAGWDSATHFVENTAQTRVWAQQNATSISSKRFEYWPEWSSKPQHQRDSQTLAADDGRPGLLAGTAAAAAPAIAAPAIKASTSPIEASTSGVETMYWESIRDSRDPADFRAYLQQYPQGAFAPLARNRLSSLTGSAR